MISWLTLEARPLCALTKGIWLCKHCRIAGSGGPCDRVCHVIFPQQASHWVSTDGYSVTKVNRIFNQHWPADEVGFNRLVRKIASKFSLFITQCSGIGCHVFFCILRLPLRPLNVLLAARRCLFSVPFGKSTFTLEPLGGTSTWRKHECKPPFSRGTQPDECYLSVRVRVLMHRPNDQQCESVALGKDRGRAINDLDPNFLI
ncbi:uncharacterized protein EI90DRAFT_376040 [Cantharellus anzutake]|uniref:uncharacterized protein n=1 Tax=Cantharellus anzutake TaxID=1750568 RepID=UPI001908EA8B|nr:uncharacterized protein EI90DRAFT_376040 [Cantharellus anzutake]KAF8334921.1 hypothetical protein EI90DRAFT_376040 [Cantharellus anzutake]